MIDKAFLFIEKEVNQYFDARFGPSTQKWVTIGNIARFTESEGGGGDTNAQAMLSLVNIEEDRISKNPENYFRTVDGIAYRNPKIFLNLYALFAATTNSYPVALQTISTIIQFFQSVNRFDRSTNPLLDPELEALTLDLYTMNFEQVNHLWSTLGGKYLPSVLYKVRVVGIEDTDKKVGGDVIREIEIRENLMSP